MEMEEFRKHRINKIVKCAPLKHLFMKDKSEIIESDCLKRNSPQYLLIEKKAYKNIK